MTGRRLTRAERALDSINSYSEGWKAIRERHIRAHAIPPREDNPEEQAWAREGTVTSAGRMRRTPAAGGVGIPPSRSPVAGPEGD